MNLRQSLFIFFSAFSIIASSQSETDLTPKYVNEFLTIGVGARGLGMSQAQVASVNDVTAGYWNPAGLAGMRGSIQAAAMHSEYFAGIAKYDYAAVAKNLDSVSTVAFSVIRFGVDDIPNTTELIDPDGNIDYNRITTFSTVDYAFIFSYGHKGLPFIQPKGNTMATSADSPQGFRWGVNAKILYRHIGDFANAWGFGLDAGVQYTKDKWHLGASARDITGTYSAWTFTLNERTKEVFQQTNNDIPQNGLEIALPRIILGGGREFQIKKFSILTELNVNVTTDGKRNTIISSNPFSVDPSFGVEVGYNRTIYFRSGVGNVQKQTDFDGSKYTTIQPNIGIGLRIKSIYLDYALSDLGNVSDVLYSNIFSLKYVFTK